MDMPINTVFLIVAFSCYYSELRTNIQVIMSSKTNRHVTKPSSSRAVNRSDRSATRSNTPRPRTNNTVITIYDNEPQSAQGSVPTPTNVPADVQTNVPTNVSADVQTNVQVQADVPTQSNVQAKAAKIKTYLTLEEGEIETDSEIDDQFEYTAEALENENQAIKEFLDRHNNSPFDFNNINPDDMSFTPCFQELENQAKDTLKRIDNARKNQRTIIKLKHDVIKNIKRAIQCTQNTAKALSEGDRIQLEAMGKETNSDELKLQLHNKQCRFLEQWNRKLVYNQRIFDYQKKLVQYQNNADNTDLQNLTVTSVTNLLEVNPLQQLFFKPHRCGICFDTFTGSLMIFSQNCIHSICIYCNERYEDETCPLCRAIRLNLYTVCELDTNHYVINTY